MRKGNDSVIENKNIAILHNDEDASVVAIMLRSVLLDNVKIYYCNHRNVNDIAMMVFDKTSNKRIKYNIFIADISISDYVANAYSSKSNIEWMLFDHHPSSRSLKSKFPRNVVFDESVSACKIVYNYLCDNFVGISSKGFMNKFKDLVDVVDEIDNNFELSSRSMTIKHMYEAFNQEYFAERFYKKPSIELTEEEHMIISSHSFKKKRYIERSVETLQLLVLPTGAKCVVVFAEMYRNDIANTIVYGDTSVDFAVVVDVRRGIASLRSKSYDVQEIALKNNGDGHERASAFNLSNSLTTRLIEEVKKVL